MGIGLGLGYICSFYLDFIVPFSLPSRGAGNAVPDDLPGIQEAHGCRAGVGGSCGGVVVVVLLLLELEQSGAPPLPFSRHRSLHLLLRFFLPNLPPDRSNEQEGIVEVPRTYGPWPQDVTFFQLSRLLRLPNPVWHRTKPEMVRGRSEETKRTN